MKESFLKWAHHLNKKPMFNVIIKMAMSVSLLTFGLTQSSYADSENEWHRYSKFSFGIGLQYTENMQHYKLLVGWLYATLGYDDGGVYEDSYREFIIGITDGWFRISDSSAPFFRTGFGLFGGLGARRVEYDDYKTATYMRHELGVEIILGFLWLYISERNFNQIGAGIGLRF